MTAQELPKHVVQKAESPNLLFRILIISTVALLAGLAGYALKTMSDDDEDRPPIFVRNSSVDIKEVSTGVPGAIAKGTSASVWFHDHINPGPKHLDVWVSGVAATSCTANGDYYRSKVNNLTVEYRLPDGPTRQVSFSVQQGGPDRFIEIGTDANAVASQPNPTELVLEGAGTRMTQVTLNGPGTNTVVCVFDSSATAEIRIMQRHQ